MKKVNILFTAAVSAVLLLTACDNASESTQEMTETTEEMTEESMEETSTSEKMDVNVDLSNSKVMWKGEMLGVYAHTGVVMFKEANVEMTGDMISGGSFVIDLTTMAATDENYNEEEGSTPEKLIGHLSSPDFFNVEQFPTANFKITGMEGADVVGELTVKGKTNTEKVTNVKMVEENGMEKVTGDLTINRQNYGITWAHPIKENVLSDDIVLTVELVKGA